MTAEAARLDDGVALSAEQLDQLKPQRAFSQYPAVHRPADSDANVMGAAMRTDGWRYVAWCQYDWTRFRPDFENCRGFELYDHTSIGAASDVDNFDLVNLAEDPGHQDLRRQLHAEMVKFWV